MRAPVDRLRRRCVAGLGLLATGLYVRPALAVPEVARASRRLLGTRVDIVAQGDAPAQAPEAIAAAFAEMARLERMMSRYRADSQVSALNRAAGRNPVAVAPELVAVLDAAAAVAARSEGAFDVTVGSYAGWRFDGAAPRVPDEAELLRQSRFVDHRHLVVDRAAGEAFLRRPGAQVDLGGIAKLPILAAGMRELARRGLRNAMVNGGGDVLVAGRIQGRDWRIGLRDPRAPDALLATLSLSDGVVASSGDYERCFVHAGRRYHHILDPRTGHCSRELRGVVLVADSVDAVNGLGAAAMAAGRERGRRLLDPLPGVDALIVDAGSEVWTSSGMARRLA